MSEAGFPMSGAEKTEHYDGAAGGWGSVRGMAATLLHERDTPGVVRTLMNQNKPGGFMCTSCAWTKPAAYRTFEFCENGAKATMWELTTRRCGPDVLAKHTLAEMRGWSDHDLEHQGRLTEPLRYDPETDHYVACGWDEAFAAIGAELKALDPASTIFYASGHASLETSYLYALFARLYGHNNLPDSSNMCHETTSVGLKAVIGSPVGTVVLTIFPLRCHLLLRPESGQNSPRFLHTLQGMRAAWREDRDLQSRARARPGSFHQSAGSAPDAHRAKDADLLPISGAAGWGHRRHAGHVQTHHRAG